jgi:hypothetical protein
MTKRALFLILLGVLCASTALAAQNKQLVFAVNGKVASGEFEAHIPYDNSIGYVDLYFSPQPLDNGRMGYSVDIYWNDGSFHEIYGQVSPGAIDQTAGWGPIQVNITYDSFIDPAGSDHEAFSSLVGTLTLYTGPGSDNIVQTGNTTEVYTREDGSTLNIDFKGVRTEQDATFEGTFGATSGSYTLSVEGPNPDADMQVFAGTFRVIETPPTE